MYGTAHSFLVPEVEKGHTQGKFKPFFQLGMALSTLSACGQKPAETTEKVMDKVNDALDRRPNEKAAMQSKISRAR
ncbi:MAG: hypothetical protein BVN30_04650 [Proteobacteria bacterium ST_bin16]|nr:MAG: hypothetical protein BVN30_04650 [Proteobacteria bacterium ST_bin16]